MRTSLPTFRAQGLAALIFTQFNVCSRHWMKGLSGRGVEGGGVRNDLIIVFPILNAEVESRHEFDGPHSLNTLAASLVPELRQAPYLHLPRLLSPVSVCQLYRSTDILTTFAQLVLLRRGPDAMSSMRIREAAPLCSSEDPQRCVSVKTHCLLPSTDCGRYPRCPCAV